MKTKNTSHRDAGFTLVEILIVAAVICLVACFSPRAKADNATTYINGGTNTFLVGTSNSIVSVVLAGTTNFYNLSSTPNSQANTNQWPACPVQIQDNMFNPSRWTTIMDQFQCGAANTGNLTVRFAGTLNGTIWQTNPCPLIMVITANGTGYAQGSTNWDSGAWQGLTVYSVENTNLLVGITNQWLGSGFDRGL